MEILPSGTQQRYTIHDLRRSKFGAGAPVPAPREWQPRTTPFHSKDKLDFICILMVDWHKTSHDMERDLSVITLPWWNGGPVPI
ncbi:MAG: hypothetical protein F4140_04585 [Cenarchaeum sp. SB0675_bin_21]|nr:hypothetical protein [Cenarchaeum sp. SB0675_bin_21]